MLWLYIIKEEDNVMQIVCVAFIGVALIKIVSPVMMRDIKHMKTMLARNHLRINMHQGHFSAVLSISEENAYCSKNMDGIGICMAVGHRDI